ncbi:MAG TPA: thiamine pyrophosphate-dependent enzyme, partial [Actinomycetota bacterium]|nr:thiamine pyrophosphate-dependent enzyme [Actinomycetota bacterium]
MAKKIASELLVERLIDWGVDTVFGLPGDGINGIMEALRRHSDRIRFVLVHHEESAAFMATGYAKSTGKLGVCLATSGGGGLHLLNGLYDAKLDHVPVLALTGMQATQLLGTGYHQEVHLEKVFEDVADYNAVAYIPGQIPALVDLAVRTSLSMKTVSHITFPVDLQEADPEESPWPGGLGLAGMPDTSKVYLPSPVVPAAANLQKAADLLNRGERVAMLVGAGALGAGPEVAEAAEILASPIIKTLPGKAVVPDDHPLTTGGLGLLGTKASTEAMEGCDTIFMVGTNFPYTSYLPEEAAGVQIESDARRVGNRLPIDVPLVGDAKETLKALTPLLTRKTERSFLENAQQGMAKWREKMAGTEDPKRSPIQPQYLMKVIDELASDDAILCGDSGTSATWAARHFHIRGNRQFLISGNLATMAAGLPYSIAAQWAHPGRQCIAFVGDGAFAMLMADFLTAVRYELPVKVVILNNGLLGQILWEQMALGYPEHGVRFERRFDFAPWATACGGFGVTVEDPAQVRGGIEAAFAHPGPAVVDVLVNPDEPPMPPKVSYEQAKGFAESFLKGEFRRTTIASTLFRDKLDEFRS